METGSNPKFDSILNKMREMHNKKASDYSHAENRYSNFEQAAVSAGIPVDAVFRTMIGIKLARLAELQGKGKTPKNESIMDSLIDLAVYATLYASYYEELPTVPDTPDVPLGFNVRGQWGRVTIAGAVYPSEPIGEHLDD